MVDHAVEASLVVCCLAVAARHDGLVHAAHAIGLRYRSTGCTSCRTTWGSCTGRWPSPGTVWCAVAVASTADVDMLGRTVGTVVLVILVAMACTARGRVRRDRHDLFEAEVCPATGRRSTRDRPPKGTSTPTGVSDLRRWVPGWLFWRGDDVAELLPTAVCLGVTESVNRAIQRRR